MDIFTELERIIRSQGISGESQADVLAAIGSPTVSIAVLDRGSIASKCISTIGGDTATLFQACSISKPITGMAVMRLVQQGKLQLEGKIVDLLPRHVVELLETPQTKPLLREITLKQLMSHTSGLSVHGFPGYVKDPPNAEVVLSGKAPANTLQVRVEGLPGHTLSYSGGGITVIQLILETVTGKDFPSLVKELVLEPLEMTRSCYALPDGETNVTYAHYTGYTTCDNKWHILTEQAAGGLWTTPTDLLKAVRAMQQSLKSDKSEQSFLEKEIAQQMLSEVSSGMALTWLAPRDPGIAFGHRGDNLPGWTCSLMGYADLNAWSGTRGGDHHVPADKAWDDGGICIMTNSAVGAKVYAKVAHAIMYLKGWSYTPIFGGAPFGGIPFCAYDVTVDKRWVDWKGKWADEENELSLEADSSDGPVLCYGKSVKVKLVPAAMPRMDYAEGRGKSIDLVLEGLEMLIRLGWKGEKRSTELWHGGHGEIFPMKPADESI